MTPHADAPESTEPETPEQNPTEVEAVEAAASGADAATNESTAEDASASAEDSAPVEEPTPSAEASAEAASDASETAQGEAEASEPEAPAEVEATDTADESAADESAADESAAEEATVEATTTESEDGAETPQEAAAASDGAAEAASEESSDAAAAKEASTPAKEEPSKAPDFVLAALESKSRLDGKVIGWNKGGFHVVLGETPAFCPRSQIEIGNPRRPDSYLNKELAFQVLELRDGGKRIVVGRRDLIRQEKKETLAALQAALKSKDPVTGSVSSVTEFGAFVALGGGIEGLIHLSQLSRQRVEKATEKVKLGQEVQVRVTKIEKGGDRISLSMKALEPDPWKGANDRYPLGGQFKGKVMRKTDFGLFVELEPGIEGLLHQSQLQDKESELDVGSEIEGWIKETNEQRQRVSLSLREVATTDPWKDVGERYSEGAVVKGEVEQVSRFGVFVQLEPGLTGLLPSSTLSLPVGAQLKRLYPIGQSLELQIDSIEAKRRRLSLAPVGSSLEGTKNDFKNYKQSQRDQGSGMNAMAAAFAKMKQK